jgi:hypothetical protein
MTLTFPMVADTVGEFLREFSLFNTDDKSTQTLRVTMQVMHYPLPYKPCISARHTPLALPGEFRARCEP